MDGHRHGLYRKVPFGPKHTNLQFQHSVTVGSVGFLSIFNLPGRIPLGFSWKSNEIPQDEWGGKIRQEHMLKNIIADFV